MTNSRLAPSLVLAAICTLAGPEAAAAQATTGELTGRIADSTGQVVVGAVVTARNADTGFQRSATTNDTGDFIITLLPPGRYTVSAERQGFKKAIRENIDVLVGTRQTVALELAIGTISEAVTVSVATPLIDTTRSDLGGVVTSKDIADLPLLNRTFANLSVMMPEARPAGNFDPTKTRVGNFAMNGGDGRQLDVNVDGGDNKDNVVGSLLQNFAYESIQEFQVLQHRWTAESGRAVGGVVNVITKSGSNTLRGSGLFTFRNENLMAKDFFQKRGATKLPFKRWEYGGSAGGPIVRDKLFFFGALERFDEPAGTTPVRADAIAQLAVVPGAQPVDSIPTPYDDTLFTAKVDQRWSDRQQLFYRFSFQKNSSPNDQVANPALTDLSGGSSNGNTLYDVIGNHTLSLGSDRVNQFSFHFQDFKNEILGVTDDPIQVFGTGTTYRIGPAPNTPQATLERKFQFRDDLTWIKEKHTLKFGTNYIYTQLGGYFYFGAFGYELLWFNDPLTIQNNTALYPQRFSTPGALRQLNYYTGASSHDQNFHQLAFYAQDDWRVNRKLTLNLGVRWDANIRLLTDQTTNRTIEILSQLNDPRARAITGDPDKLSRTTPGWAEFQPRLGFAYDYFGDGRLVVRGGYGLFYDQIFQNLTVFSLSQSGPEIYSQTLALTNTAVGTGQIANFRYGIDPLPAPPAFDFSQLPAGSFGRINDPEASDPYVHKVSIGFETVFHDNWTFASDYVHTEGRNEPRVMNINPQIRSVCDAAFPGANPADPRCVRSNRASGRYFDAAFVAAGMPANRLEQINMIGTTNSSKFDSWTTTVKHRRTWGALSMSYVLANSRAWGGQPVASYSGNGIAVTPEQQFADGEFGPTRIDERHRFVASATMDLPYGVQIAPIVQWSSSRPYTPTAGYDINGDGLVNILDRLCDGVDPRAVFDVRGNTAAVLALNPNGCRLAPANSQRSGLVVNADGSVEDRSGRFFNVDLRIGKSFTVGPKAVIRAYVDFYNLFNTENLSFTLRPEQSSAASASQFMQVVSLAGPGFGPPVGRPFTASFGARVTF